MYFSAPPPNVLNLRISKRKNSYLISIVLLFNFFPWLSLSLNSFDMQPWTLLVNTLFIFKFLRTEINWLLYVFYCLFGFVLFLAMLNFGYYALRSLASYYLLVTGFHLYYIIFKLNFKLFVRVLIAANFIWIFFGLIQLFLGVESLSGLVNLRSSSDRGMTSLSPEPTHFGFHLFFFSWILLILSNFKLLERSRVFFIVSLNFLSILLLAKSSMALIYFILVIIVFFLSVNANPIRIILFFAGMLLISIFSYAYLIYDSDSRISNVVFALLDDPFVAIRDDASVNARFSHLVLSILASFHSLFYPHGFSSFYSDSVFYNDLLGGFFWYNYQSNIIMSGTGALLYELGFIGVFFILATAVYMMGMKIFNKFGFFSFLLLWMLMFGAIPISYPMLPAVATLVHFFNRKNII